MFDKKDIDRFWSKIKIKSKEECWIWLAYKDKDGYGNFSYKGKNYQAHIVAFAINIGIWPTGLIIRHICNNPSCCNPNHLLEGTYKENSQDMVLAGQSLKGSKNPKAIITEKEAEQIKQLGWHFNATQISRMPQYKGKIPYLVIWRILYNITWK